MGAGEMDTIWDAFGQKNPQLAGVRAEDISPGMHAPALIGKNGKRYLGMLKWGFATQNGLTINARLETIWEKPMFRQAASDGRCVLLACAYYEWRRGDGQKYRISLQNGGLIYLAGLYRPDGSFVVVTRPADAETREIHPRMPLVFPSKALSDAWLQSEADARAIRDALPEISLRAEAQGPEQQRMNFDEYE